MKFILNTTGIIMLFIFLCFCIITYFNYKKDINNANNRLKEYDVKTFEGNFGNMSYIDEGEGEAVLISHGIFGGYDQGIVSLREILGNNYRKISPSRFGYPGSDLPSEATPKNQAEVFNELLDELKISKAYIFCTSAGGSAGLRFAIDYPERVKGLILLSSGVPDKKRTTEEIKELGMMGPPDILVNNFPMWFSLKYFGFIFNYMFGSKIDNDGLLQSMLPVEERKKGIEADTKCTNIDMSLNYDDYPVEKIKVPILLIAAKDDPMVKYENTEIFLHRVNAKSVIYEDGGHLLSGHNSNEEVCNFIENTK